MQVIANAYGAATLTVATGASYNAFQVASGLPGAGSQLNLALPGTNRQNGQPFTVRASGYMTCPAGTYTSAATPIQFVLFGSNTASFSAATGNALFSTTALAIFSVSSATAKSVPWEIEIECSGDSTSAGIVGAGQAITGAGVNLTTGVATARAAIGSPTSAGTFNFATEPPINFAAGVSTASANLLLTTTVVLSQFCIEA